MALLAALPLMITLALVTTALRLDTALEADLAIWVALAAKPEPLVKALLRADATTVLLTRAAAGLMGACKNKSIP